MRWGENGVAGLDVGRDIDMTQRGEKLAQIGHGELPATADIYAAEQCNMGRHEPILPG
jgi:hypothetical protein